MIDIEDDNFQTRERLSSINEASDTFYFSSDIVERAYSELYRLRIVTSSFKKEYCISGKSNRTNKKLFLLVCSRQ